MTLLIRASFNEIIPLRAANVIKQSAVSSREVQLGQCLCPVHRTSHWACRQLLPPKSLKTFISNDALIEVPKHMKNMSMDGTKTLQQFMGYDFIHCKLIVKRDVAWNEKVGGMF